MGQTLSSKFMLIQLTIWKNMIGDSLTEVIHVHLIDVTASGRRGGGGTLIKEVVEGMREVGWKDCP